MGCHWCYGARYLKLTAIRLFARTRIGQTETGIYDDIRIFQISEQM